MRCCAQGYESALELAAWASGFEVSSLKTYYQESVQISWFDTMQQPAPDFDEDCDSDEETSAHSKSAESDWSNFSFGVFMLFNKC